MKRQRMLITGVSGLLGSNLAWFFRNDYEIMGLFHQHSFSPVWAITRRVDLLKGGEFAKALKYFRPDVCIHCAAIADIDFCEAQPERAYAANVQATRIVTDVTADQGCYLVHISTDNVFNGEKGNYTEEDAVSPLSCYAETKVQAEIVVSAHPAALIVRTSFYGTGGLTKRSLVDWALEELSSGRKIKGLTDAITSNIYVRDLADILSLACDKRLTGIYHMASSSARSKYDLLCDAAWRAGLDPVNITPVNLADFMFKARRPGNLSLNIRKAQIALNPHIFPDSQQSLSNYFDDKRSFCDRV